MTVAVHRTPFPGGFLPHPRHLAKWGSKNDTGAPLVTPKPSTKLGFSSPGMKQNSQAAQEPLLPGESIMGAPCCHALPWLIFPRPPRALADAYGDQARAAQGDGPAQAPLGQSLAESALLYSLLPEWQVHFTLQ